MKVRSGFVSNSSSSSFIVLTTPQNIESIKRQYAGNPFLEFIEAVLSARQKQADVHGMKLIDLSRTIHDGYVDEWDDEERGRGDITGWDLWLQLMDEIKSGGGYVKSEYQ